MKYEEKIKFAVLLFRGRSTNSFAESPGVQSQRRHKDAQPLAPVVRRVADAAFTYAYLTSGPYLQMFARKTTNL
ncbi:hypothetical protein [Microcoleus sp. D2_18a_B4]|uniref:hypothetical protein n=1 Tax=Microcoleus sp. D2_18a_B4 TaxID=3055329 RepID=UPI002FD18C36